MKTTEHLIGDRVSVRCKRTHLPPGPPRDRDLAKAVQPDVYWAGGNIIGRDVRADHTRYVVQLDDQRRVVAFDDDLRRFTLAFEVVEMLERMAS